MSTNVVMPQLGESVVEGTVGKWLKRAGDNVALYEPLLEVVTDKVTTEVPSPAAGVLSRIIVPEGETVRAGTVIALIGQPDETPAPAAAAPTTTETRSSNPSLTSTQVGVSPPAVSALDSSAAGQTKPNGAARNRLTPVVARMISEYNISDAELGMIEGTGENGRISKKDIETLLSSRQSAPAGAESLPPWEQPGTGELFRPTEEVFGKVTPAVVTAAVAKAAVTTPAAETTPTDGEIIRLSPIRRTIAEHMVRSKTIAAHVTTVHEADMSRVLTHHARHQDEFTNQGVKLTYTPYLIQAVVYGLQQVPIVNAQFTEQGILTKRELNIGLAVAIEEGLIVPVVKNADDKSLLGLARAVNDLAGRARDKKLTADEVSGGTFTVTNYGVFGSLFGTPIISQPQSAILGVGAIQKRVVVKSDAALGDVMAIRPMVYLALSFDHRLLDGAIADTFMNKLKHFLENYGD